MIWPFISKSKAFDRKYDRLVESMEGHKRRLYNKALRDGGATLYPESNIAPGTYGYALYQLEMEGLMTAKSDTIRVDPITWAIVVTFSLTEKGKAAQAVLSEAKA